MAQRHALQVLGSALLGQSSGRWDRGVALLTYHLPSSTTNSLDLKPLYISFKGKQFLSVLLPPEGKHIGISGGAVSDIIPATATI